MLGTTNNANVKKKSKAPIIIVVVLILVLLLGCLTIGGVVVGFQIFKNAGYEIEKDKAENLIKNITNTNTNNILTNTNSYNTNTSKTNNTNTNTSKANNTNTVNNVTNNAVANNVNNTVTNNSVNNKTNNNTSNSSKVTDAKSSTKESPLEKGVWGIASKYSTETKNYEDVYIKVTNVIRGEDAKKAVQDYCNSKTYIKYEDPKEGLEWVVLDYDLDFADYTKSSLGANAEVTASIKGVGDNSSVKYKGVTYILSSRYIGSSDYVKTQDAKGKIAFQMPIGCKDYIIQFGAYNNTNAFFKCE